MLVGSFSPRSAVGVMVERVNEAMVDVLHDVVELLGQDDVLAINGVVEQRGYLIHRDSRDTAADLRHQELQLRMLLGKADELIHIGFNGIDSSVHCWDAIALALQPNTLAPYCTKAFIGQTCCPAAMRACQVAAKHEDFILLQFRNPFGCVFFVGHSLHFICDSYACCCSFHPESDVATVIKVGAFVHEALGGLIDLVAEGV